MLAIIIQARLASTRYPGKILIPIYKEKTVLDLLLENLKTLNIKLVIATTFNESDKAIIETAHKHGVDYFRGDENNVLKRYIDCAKEYGINKIIRITSDNVFIQPDLIKPLIKLENSDYDYVSYQIRNKNVVLTHWGFFGEFVTMKALENVINKSSDKRDLEHVTYYIYNHPYDFNLSFLNVPLELERNDVRLTIDIKEDFEICREILNHFFRNNIEMNYTNILNYIDNNPLLLEQMKYNIKHSK